MSAESPKNTQRSARRRLDFGSPGKENQLAPPTPQKTIAELLDEETQVISRRYNFDFNREVALEGDFAWEQVPVSSVPQFYSSAKAEPQIPSPVRSRSDPLPAPTPKAMTQEERLSTPRKSMWVVFYILVGVYVFVFVCLFTLIACFLYFLIDSFIGKPLFFSVLVLVITCSIIDRVALLLWVILSADALIFLMGGAETSVFFYFK